MKKLFTTFFVIALAAGCLLAGEAKVAGKWQMNVDTPHGPMQASLTLKQDGAKITGTCDSDHLGSLPINGTIVDQKITFTMEIPDGQTKITMTGTIDGNKINGTMEPMGGKWTASKQ